MACHTVLPSDGPVLSSRSAPTEREPMSTPASPEVARAGRCASRRARDWLRSFRPSVIDRYLLAQAMRPFIVSILVVLLTLLLERLLRLFDMFATSSDAFHTVAQLLADLVPHYLGLALPAGFFISVFSVMARLRTESELDALMSAGLSVQRIARPFLLVGLALGIFGIALYGYLQPYTRYTYRALFYAASHSGWSPRLQPGMFVDVSGKLQLTADRVSSSGRQMEGVFLRQSTENGERIVTAASGDLLSSEDRERVVLLLHDGSILRDGPDGQPSVTQFGEATFNIPLTPRFAPFRQRGESERELTLNELAEEASAATPQLPVSRLRAELHSRLARAFSLPLVPLLAVPLAMTAKRRQHSAGLVIASAILVSYHHLLNAGASLAATGALPVFPAVWGPAGIFAALCLWLFVTAGAAPRDNWLTRSVEAVQAASAVAWRCLRPRHRAP